MEEFLKEIGIEDEGSYSDDGCYIIDIPNDRVWGKYFSLLDKSDLVDLDEDSSQRTESASSMQFESDDYLITLMDDYDADLYSLTIKEK